MEKTLTYSIESLSPDDIPAFVDMVERHASEGFPHLPHNRYIIINSLKSILGNARFFLKVAKLGMELKGYYLGQASPYMFTEGFLLVLQYIYVLPESRGSSLFSRLIKDFEEEGREHGARELLCGIESGINVDKVGRIFEKKGYKFVGNFYRKQNV